VLVQGTEQPASHAQPEAATQECWCPARRGSPGARAGRARRPASRAIEERAIESRHAEDHRHAAHLERAHQLGTRERLRQDEREPAAQREEHADHEGVDVVQRQRQQQAVVALEQVHVQQRVELELEVGVRQRHALGGPVVPEV
jgi:hypothetical protein